VLKDLAYDRGDLMEGWRIMNTAKTLLADFLRAFYAPKPLYTDIYEGRSTPSWLCVLVYCLIYMAGTLWLYLSGFEPFVEPWIKLDPQIYYLVETFYLTPLIFLMWILGAGMIHVLGRLVGGRGNRRGSFDTTLVMTGYSLWAPWYPLIVVDSIHTTPEWLYNTVLTVCVLFILGGTSVATRVAYRIGWLACVVISILTFLSIGGIIFTFIR
jgi:hypothetical protein